MITAKTKGLAWVLRAWGARSRHDNPLSFVPERTIRQQPIQGRSLRSAKAEPQTTDYYLRAQTHFGYEDVGHDNHARVTPCH
jgi:hypothetical protein